MSQDPIDIQRARRLQAEDGAFRSALERLTGSAAAEGSPAALPMPARRAAPVEAAAATPSEPVAEPEETPQKASEPELCADCMQSSSDSGSPFASGHRAA